MNLRNKIDIWVDQITTKDLWIMKIYAILIIIFLVTKLDFFMVSAYSLGSGYTFWNFGNYFKEKK